MQTISLTNVTLELNNVNLQTQQNVLPGGGTSAYLSLYVYANIKAGTKTLAGYSNNFQLSDVELSGSFSSLETLAVTKVKQDLGI